jgi:3-hydroxyisobutyrate dehydrogenase
VTGTEIGFIGLGRMGAPMAARLTGAGHALTVLDASASAMDGFLDGHPGRRAATARELAAASEVVITMLPTSAIVAAVLGNGDDNVFAGMKPDTVVIEMSSGIPSITQELAEKVASLGGHMIDAPVSGGVPRAKTGELAIMVGGDPKIIDRVMPVLSAMGANVLRTGAIGSGQAMKALNNLVSAGGFLIGIEALLIGQRFGLDPAVMTDVLNAATGMNNSTQKKFKQYVLSRKFDAGFSMGLLAKDLSIALQVGRETATATPFSALCKELVLAAQAMFGPDADHTEMAKLCETLTGTTLGA